MTGADQFAATQMRFLAVANAIGNAEGDVIGASLPRHHGVVA